MAIAFVQESTRTTTSGNPSSGTISISPTAGNALVVPIGHQGTSTGGKTVSVSDNIDGTTGWSQRKVEFSDIRYAIVAYKANVPSGVTTITVTWSSSASPTNCTAQEFSGVGTAFAEDAFDSLEEVAASDNHTCSALGVTSVKSVIAICVGLLTGNATECSAGSGYTEVPSGQADVNEASQYQLFPTGCTLEVGAWTSTGTDRTARSLIVLLSGNAAAGRTTKNTRSSPLGMEIGMDWRGEL